MLCVGLGVAGNPPPPSSPLPHKFQGFCKVHFRLFFIICFCNIVILLNRLNSQQNGTSYHALLLLFSKLQLFIENNAATWEQYKQARNETNNAIKSAKRQYFLHNLELNKKNSSKTWKLINELSSRKSCTNRNITEIKTDNETINSAPEFAEAFNNFFTSIGPNLASKLSPSNIDPESYLQPTKTASSLRALSVTTAL